MPQKGLPMEVRIYAIRDAKAGFYTTLLYKHTHGEAERDFTQIVRDPNSTPHSFPEDYDLYHLGSYDNVEGKFSSLATPQHIMKGVSVKKADTPRHNSTT